MKTNRFVAWLLVIGPIALAPGVVCGQNYPNKPVRIVTSGVGGGSDLAARIIAQSLSGILGQQAIVDNRGNAAAEVAKAAPDGYTLLFWGTNTWLDPLMRNTAWDPIRDLAPISLAVSSPNILVVHPSVPAKSVKELIALAKSRPGELNYASGGTGATSHLAAELFKAMARVDMVRISYRGNGPAVRDLLGGHVQLMFATAASVAPHMKSKKLRALAVTSPEPTTLVPGLPTVAASLPGYESTGRWGMFAPIKTSPAIINRLHQDLVQVLNKPEVKEDFFNLGVEIIGGSPERFGAVIKSEMARMGKVIKDAGITAD